MCERSRDTKLKILKVFDLSRKQREKICQFPMGNVVLLLAGLLIASTRGCNVQIGLCSVAG
jgi:hypothetical protein